MVQKMGSVAVKNTISKMEAVRKSLAKLGKSAMPVEIQSFIKSSFGMAMSTGHISNYKTDILRKAAGKSANKSTSKPAMAKPMVKAPVAAKPMVKAPVAAKPMAKAPVAAKPMAKAPVVAKMMATSAPMPMAASATAGISLEDIEMVKGLLAHIGAGNLKALVDLLG